MWTARFALAAIIAVGVTREANAQTPEPMTPSAMDAAAAPSLDLIVGKTLTAIDGSTIALTVSEGGVTREIVGPNGRAQKNVYGFLNDKLGTVANPAQPTTIIGVFRAGDALMEISFADGSSELLRAIPGGGVSLVTKSGDAESCIAWYPSGHAFSIEERKAALSQYASHLGLAEPGEIKLIPTATGCTVAPVTAPAQTAEIAKPETPVKPETPAKPELAMKTAMRMPKPGTAKVAAALKTADAVKAGDPLPDTKPVEVRASDVHPIDVDAATILAPPPIAPPAPAADTKAADAKADDTKAADEKAADATPADAKPAVTKVAIAEPPPPFSNQSGASSCLSVESDGKHWGFRNHCGYSIQFAYCLMSDNDQLAACRDGSVVGSVAPNAFGALVADESLKETDALHDFRWVACQGGAGEVIPHLDQTTPPAGRCVRSMSGGG